MLGSRRTIVPWRPARQADRRLGWGIGDQAVSSLTNAVSSLTNFAVNIYIAGLFMTSPTRPAPMTAPRPRSLRKSRQESGGSWLRDHTVSQFSGNSVQRSRRSRGT